CLHHPKTHEMVKLLRDILNVAAPGVSLITETNVPHADNVGYLGDGRDEAQMAYNFSLPPLVLHTFRTGDAEALTRWSRALAYPSDGGSFLNFLDSHDGIGLLGARGLLSEEDIAALTQMVRSRGGLVSERTTDNGRKVPYELNTTLWDAINDPRRETDEGLDLQTRRFLAARAIALLLRGVPAIYLHGLLGSSNDVEAARRTGVNRDVNRRNISQAELDDALRNPATRTFRVFTSLKKMLAARARHKAFHPQGKQTVLALNPGVFAVLRESPDGREKILGLVEVAGKTHRLPIDPEILGAEEGRPLTDAFARSAVDFKDGSVSLAPYQVLWLTPRRGFRLTLRLAGQKLRDRLAAFVFRRSADAKTPADPPSLLADVHAGRQNVVYHDPASGTAAHLVMHGGRAIAASPAGNAGIHFNVAGEGAAPRWIAEVRPTRDGDLRGFESAVEISRPDFELQDIYLGSVRSIRDRIRSHGGAVVDPRAARDMAELEKKGETIFATVVRHAVRADGSVLLELGGQTQGKAHLHRIRLVFPKGTAVEVIFFDGLDGPKECVKAVRVRGPPAETLRFHTALLSDYPLPTTHRRWRDLFEPSALAYRDRLAREDAKWTAARIRRSTSPEDVRAYKNLIADYQVSSSPERADGIRELEKRILKPSATSVLDLPVEKYHEELPFLKHATFEKMLGTLRFLVTGEGVLAGSWQYLSYFGRDSLLVLRLLDQLLTPEAYKDLLSSVLRRVNENGEVAHEEDLRRSGESPERLDYRMHDGELMLLTLAQRFMDNPRFSHEEKRAFWETTGPERQTGATRTNGEILKRTAAYVLRKAEKLDADADTGWVGMKQVDGQTGVGDPTGNWRDAVDSLARGMYAGDVNAVWMPAALKAVRDLQAADVFHLPETRLLHWIEVWDKASSSFRIYRTKKDRADRFDRWLLDRLRRFPADAPLVFALLAQAMARKESETTEHLRALNDAWRSGGAAAVAATFHRAASQNIWAARGLGYLALAKDLKGRNIAAVNGDYSTFAPLLRRLSLRELKSVLRAILVPAALGGLRVRGVGVLSANPLLAGQHVSDPVRLRNGEPVRSVWDMLSFQSYHGMVVWPAMVNIMLQGWIEQAEALLDARRRNDAQMLYAAIELVRADINSAGALKNHEVLSLNAAEDGQLVAAPFSGEVESNYLQAWNAASEIAVQLSLDKLRRRLGAGGRAIRSQAETRNPRLEDDLAAWSRGEETATEEETAAPAASATPPRSPVASKSPLTLLARPFRPLVSFFQKKKTPAPEEHPGAAAQVQTAATATADLLLDASLTPVQEAIPSVVKPALRIVVSAASEARKEIFNLPAMEEGHPTRAPPETLFVALEKEGIPHDVTAAFFWRAHALLYDEFAQGGLERITFVKGSRFVAHADKDAHAVEVDIEFLKALGRLSEQDEYTVSGWLLAHELNHLRISGMSDAFEELGNVFLDTARLSERDRGVVRKFLENLKRDGHPTFGYERLLEPQRTDEQRMEAVVEFVWAAYPEYRDALTRMTLADLRKDAERLESLMGSLGANEKFFAARWVRAMTAVTARQKSAEVRPLRDFSRWARVRQLFSVAPKTRKFLNNLAENLADGCEFKIENPRYIVTLDSHGQDVYRFDVKLRMPGKKWKKTSLLVVADRAEGDAPRTPKMVALRPYSDTDGYHLLLEGAPYTRVFEAVRAWLASYHGEELPIARDKFEGRELYDAVFFAPDRHDLENVLKNPMLWHFLTVDELAGVLFRLDRLAVGGIDMGGFDQEGIMFMAPRYLNSAGHLSSTIGHEKAHSLFDTLGKPTLRNRAVFYALETHFSNLRHKPLLQELAQDPTYAYAEFPKNPDSLFSEMFAYTLETFLLLETKTLFKTPLLAEDLALLLELGYLPPWMNPGKFPQNVLPAEYVQNAEITSDYYGFALWNYLLSTGDRNGWREMVRIAPEETREALKKTYARLGRAELQEAFEELQNTVWPVEHVLLTGLRKDAAPDRAEWKKRAEEMAWAEWKSTYETDKKTELAPEKLPLAKKYIIDQNSSRTHIIAREMEYLQEILKPLLRKLPPADIEGLAGHYAYVGKADPLLRKLLLGYLDALTIAQYQKAGVITQRGKIVTWDGPTKKMVRELTKKIPLPAEILRPLDGQGLYKRYKVRNLNDLLRATSARITHRIERQERRRGSARGLFPFWPQAWVQKYPKTLAAVETVVLGGLAGGLSALLSHYTGWDLKGVLTGIGLLFSLVFSLIHYAVYYDIHAPPQSLADMTPGERWRVRGSLFALGLAMNATVAAGLLASPLVGGALGLLAAIGVHLLYNQDLAPLLHLPLGILPKKEEPVFKSLSTEEFIEWVRQQPRTPPTDSARQPAAPKLKTVYHATDVRLAGLIAEYGLYTPFLRATLTDADSKKYSESWVKEKTWESLVLLVFRVPPDWTGVSIAAQGTVAHGSLGVRNKALLVDSLPDEMLQSIERLGLPQSKWLPQMLRDTLKEEKLARLPAEFLDIDATLRENKHLLSDERYRELEKLLTEAKARAETKKPAAEAMLPAPVFGRPQEIVWEWYRNDDLLRHEEAMAGLKLDAAYLKKRLDRLVEDDLRTRLPAAALKPLSSNTGYLDVFDAPDSNFVVKIPNTVTLKDPKDLQKLLANYETAAERLGGLVPSMTILRDVTLTVNGVPQSYPFVILQEKVTPLEKSAAYSTSREETFHQLAELTKALWARGVFDADFYRLAENYGLTADGRLVLFDLSNITTNIDRLVLFRESMTFFSAELYELYQFSEIEKYWEKDPAAGRPAGPARLAGAKLQAAQKDVIARLTGAATASVQETVVSFDLSALQVLWQRGGEGFHRFFAGLRARPDVRLVINTRADDVPGIERYLQETIRPSLLKTGSISADDAVVHDVLTVYPKELPGAAVKNKAEALRLWADDNKLDLSRTRFIHVDDSAHELRDIGFYAGPHGFAITTVGLYPHNPAYREEIELSPAHHKIGIGNFAEKFGDILPPAAPSVTALHAGTVLRLVKMLIRRGALAGVPFAKVLPLLGRSFSAGETRRLETIFESLARGASRGVLQELTRLVAPADLLRVLLKLTLPRKTVPVKGEAEALRARLEKLFNAQKGDLQTAGLRRVTVKVHKGMDMIEGPDSFILSPFLINADGTAEFHVNRLLLDALMKLDGKKRDEMLAALIEREISLREHITDGLSFDVAHKKILRDPAQLELDRFARALIAGETVQPPSAESAPAQATTVPLEQIAQENLRTFETLYEKFKAARERCPVTALPGKAEPVESLLADAPVFLEFKELAAADPRVRQSLGTHLSNHLYLREGLSSLEKLLLLPGLVAATLNGDASLAGTSQKLFGHMHSLAETLRAFARESSLDPAAAERVVSLAEYLDLQTWKAELSILAGILNTSELTRPAIEQHPAIQGAEIVPLDILPADYLWGQAPPQLLPPLEKRLRELSSLNALESVIFDETQTASFRLIEQVTGINRTYRPGWLTRLNNAYKEVLDSKEDAPEFGDLRQFIRKELQQVSTGKINGLPSDLRVLQKIVRGKIAELRAERLTGERRATTTAIRNFEHQVVDLIVAIIEHSMQHRTGLKGTFSLTQGLAGRGNCWARADAFYALAKAFGVDAGKLIVFEMGGISGDFAYHGSNLVRSLTGGRPYVWDVAFEGGLEPRALRGSDGSGRTLYFYGENKNEVLSGPSDDVWDAAMYEWLATHLLYELRGRRRAQSAGEESKIPRHFFSLANADSFVLQKIGALLQKALELDPESGSLLSAASDYYFELGDYERALELITRAIEVQKPPFPTFYYNLSVTLARLGRWHEALKAMRQALTLRNDFFRHIPFENRAGYMWETNYYDEEREQAAPFNDRMIQFALLRQLSDAKQISGVLNLRGIGRPNGNAFLQRLIPFLLDRSGSAQPQLLAVIFWAVGQLENNGKAITAEEVAKMSARLPVRLRSLVGTPSRKDTLAFLRRIETGIPLESVTALHAGKLPDLVKMLIHRRVLAGVPFAKVLPLLGRSFSAGETRRLETIFESLARGASRGVLQELTRLVAPADLLRALLKLTLPHKTVPVKGEAEALRARLEKLFNAQKGDLQAAEIRRVTVKVHEGTDMFEGPDTFILSPFLVNADGTAEFHVNRLLLDALMKMDGKKKTELLDALISREINLRKYILKDLPFDAAHKKILEMDGQEELERFAGTLVSLAMLQDNPADPELWLHVGEMFEDQSDDITAAKAYLALLRLQPARPAPWAALGRILDANDELTAAKVAQQFAKQPPADGNLDAAFRLIKNSLSKPKLWEDMGLGAFDTAFRAFLKASPEERPRLLPELIGRFKVFPNYFRKGHSFGPYEIVKPLGAGAMGAVYKAVDSRTGKTVAIKINMQGTLNSVEHFLKEGRHLKRLHDLKTPAKVLFPAFVAMGQDPQTRFPFIVMEYVDGSNLEKFIEARGPPKNSSDLEVSLRIAAQILQILQTLKQTRLTHNDLKPDNVMLQTRTPSDRTRLDETYARAKLMDFGIAAPVGEELTMFFGPFGYIPPEVARSYTPAAKSDIFAFGILLFHLLTGVHPVVFAGKELDDFDSTREIIQWTRRGVRDWDAEAAGLPLSDLKKLIQKTLSQNPD
ncbi:MAG TPA: protein kinase, partial [Elusimicrobiota bacterium]|nr:protein kinase [Elusimicrobiota bacterium]